MALMSPDFASPLKSAGRPSTTRHLDAGRFTVKMGSTGGGIVAKTPTFAADTVMSGSPRAQASAAAAGAGLTPDQQAAIGKAIGDGVKSGIDAILNGDKGDDAAAAAAAAQKKAEQKKMLMIGGGVLLAVIVIVVVMKKRG